MGVLLAIDPSSSKLLIRDGESLIVVDAVTGKRLAERNFEEPSYWQRIDFQDTKHVLVSRWCWEKPRQLVSDRILRWNFEDDTLDEVSVGGMDAKTHDRWMMKLGFLTTAWFLVGLTIARTSRHWFAPGLFWLSITVLVLTWAFAHPDYYSMYLYREGFGPWFAMVVTWTVFAFLATYLIAKLEASFSLTVTLETIAICVAADRLHNVFAHGTWFLPAAIFFACPATLLLMRFFQRRSRSEKQSQAIRRSFSIRDLVLLTIAIAVFLATLFRFDTPYLTDNWWPNMLGVAIALATVGSLSIWAGGSSSAVWKRYLVLVLGTVGIAAVASRFGWIDFLVINDP